MKYKDSNNQLHEIEPEFAHLLPSDCVPITDEEANIIRLENEAIAKAEYEASLTYQQKRQQAHLPIQDQLDMIYWDQVNGTTNFKDYVTAIKVAIPKEQV